MGAVTHLPKDGDGNEESFVSNYTIDIVCNGYILHITYEDGEEVIEVYTDKDVLIKQLKKYL